MSWKDVKRIDGGEGNVWKYVFTKEDAVAEAVLYRYASFKERTVICCSTQSGCPVGCRFCGAGDKFIRSLSTQEIIDQVGYLLENQDINSWEIEKFQIMFMSMGEPLINFAEVSEAIETLYALYPNAKLLLSTSGPDIDYFYVQRLSVKVPTVGLQFSVHESTDEARDKLIPFKHKLSLKQIAYEGEEWFKATGRKPFFNYCAHAGNTSNEDVHRLGRLFDSNIWECTISVICERDEGVAAANKRQRELASTFMQKMVAKGYSTRMFDPAGQDDIGGGCGQLWYVQDWMKKHGELGRLTFNSLPVIHAPK